MTKRVLVHLAVGEPQPFGALVDGLPAVAFDCAPSGELRAISTYWAELTGQSSADAMGSGWTKHFDGDGLSTALTQLANAARLGEAVRFVVRCRDRSGEWCWLRVVARPRLEDGGVAGIAGLAILIPAAEVVDEGTRVRVDEAERLAARADAFLAASPDLLFQVNQAGVYVGYRAADPGQLYVTPERFLGKTLEETLPPPIARLSVRVSRRSRRMSARTGA